MTDSKKPPSREEFQRLRETVAAQSEVIEEYLPDDPQKRKFLGEAAKGLGAVGALGIAGQSGYAVGQASAEASTSDTDTDIGSPSNRHDLFAEGVDANSVSTGSLNNSITYASENDAGLPGVQEAINNASVGQTVYIISGEHDTYSSGGTVEVNTRIHLHFGGYIVGSNSNGDPGLRINEPCQLSSDMAAHDSPPRNAYPVCVYGGDPGIEYRAAVFGGIVGVYFTEGHAHHFLQAASGDNCNGTELSLEVQSPNGNGVVIENTTTDGDNLNAMKLNVLRGAATGSNGDGIIIQQIDGRACNFRVGIATSSSKIWETDTVRNWLKVDNSEINTGTELDFLSNSSYNFVMANRTVGKGTANGSYNLVQANTRMPLRSVTGGVSAGDIAPEEAAFDVAGSALAWKDESGSAYQTPGLRKLESGGPVTVSAGGSTQVGSVTNVGQHLVVDAWIADPDNASADAEIDTKIRLNNSGPYQEAWVEELLGNSSVDVNWAIYEREASL